MTEINLGYYRFPCQCVDEVKRDGDGPFNYHCVINCPQHSKGFQLFRESPDALQIKTLDQTESAVIKLLTSEA